MLEILRVWESQSHEEAEIMRQRKILAVENRTAETETTQVLVLALQTPIERPTVSQSPQLALTSLCSTFQPLPVPRHSIRNAFSYSVPSEPQFSIPTH